MHGRSAPIRTSKPGLTGTQCSCMHTPGAVMHSMPSCHVRHVSTVACGQKSRPRTKPCLQYLGIGCGSKQSQGAVVHVCSQSAHAQRIGPDVKLPAAHQQRVGHVPAPWQSELGVARLLWKERLSDSAVSCVQAEKQSSLITDTGLLSSADVIPASCLVCVAGDTCLPWTFLENGQVGCRRTCPLACCCSKGSWSRGA